MDAPEERSSSHKRHALVAIQAVVSLALIGWIVARFDLSRAIEVVSQARLEYVAVGFALANGMMLLLGVRFVQVLRKGRLELPRAEAIRIAWVGQFWNFFLPGSTGGDLYRLGALWTAHPERKTDATLAVFVDRLIATALLAALAGVGVFVLPLGSAFERWLEQQHLPVGRLALVGLAVATIGVGMALIGPVRRRAAALARGIFDRLEAGRVFLVPDRQLAAIIGLAMAGHAVNFTVFYCYARAVGLEITYWQVWFMLPVVLMVLILPISINGHGVREVVFVLMLTALDVGSAGNVPLPERVIALSVVGLSSDFVIGLAGGVAFVLSRWSASRAVATRDAMLSQR
ncbi:MAG: flippase-like domain-containing protein [Opitutae bacterium]|nr:flippase-like domain-containing protein [Opitutae bacterium]